MDLFEKCTKKKTVLQKNVDNNLDLFLYQGNVIRIFERKLNPIPCAYADVSKFHEEFANGHLFQNVKLISIMYDLNAGNVGTINALYIHPHSAPNRKEIISIGQGLPEYISINDWEFYIEWEVKMLEECWEGQMK
jgi:hypothetical protein